MPTRWPQLERNYPASLIREAEGGGVFPADNRANKLLP